MDSKLKSLKVADLKAILNKANVSAPAKATKADLISRITCSQVAIDTYNALYPSNNATASVVTPATSHTPAAVPQSGAVPPVLTTEDSQSKFSEPTTFQVSADDTEEEKRKKRAARFGIPVIEARPAKAKAAKAPTEDLEKLNSRALRFGVGLQKKRNAEAELDPEEAERRRKRAERFGVPMDSKA